jgi:c-di-GMP phosphodiesterase
MKDRPRLDRGIAREHIPRAMMATALRLLPESLPRIRGKVFCGRRYFKAQSDRKHMADYLIGRQPIFNRRMDVIGYELLYRGVDSSRPQQPVDGDLATTQVILNAFSEIGLESIVGEHVAFINATQNFLLGRLPIPFSPDKVVLEVLEDIAVDQQLIAGLKQLKQSGFRLALDDVISFEPIQAMLGIANIVKVDLKGVRPSDLSALVESLKPSGVKLLAEKVETQAEYAMCYRMGFEFFQGYFLCKPTVLKGQRMDVSRLVVLQSMSTLQDPNATFESVEHIVALDVTLGYKLLKLINSSFYSLSTPVTSIRQAISLIGFDQLRGWVTLLLMSAVQNKPHELTVIALLRAKMCELFARALNLPHPETFFLVGLMSILDALMDMSMAQLLTNLPLSQEIVDALLERKGSHGAVLTMVLAYEMGDWDTVMQSNLDCQTIHRIYLESIRWSNLLTKSLSAEGAAP